MLPIAAVSGFLNNTPVVGSSGLSIPFRSISIDRSLARVEA